MDFSNLPRDVLFNILSRLPVKPLIRFSLSSKQFRFFIQHPQFINLHFTRSRSNLPQMTTSSSFTTITETARNSTVLSLVSKMGVKPVENKKFEVPFKSLHGYVRIVGSSGGLVSLFDTNFYSYKGGLILWNVIIEMSNRLPHSHLTQRYRDSFSHMVVGFGFVLATNDFKVVQILYDCDADVIPDVLVYSMESNSWRKVEAIAPCYMPNRWSSNVYVNGAVHWLAYRRPRVGHLCKSIMSFDMSGEVFREMALPNNRSNGYDILQLSVSASGKTLFLFFHCTDRWEVWLMQDYGVVDYWMRQFSIAGAQMSLPLTLNFLDSGVVLLAMKSGNLVLCDARLYG